MADQRPLNTHPGHHACHATKPSELVKARLATPSPMTLPRRLNTNPDNTRLPRHWQPPRSNQVNPPSLITLPHTV